MIDYRNEIAPKMLGLWPEFFANIGIDVGVMRGQNSKNGPCPLCSVDPEDDRAHWREQDGRIALYCRQCSDNSMHSPEYVYMQATGRSFAEFVQDAANFISFVPTEVFRVKAIQCKMLREPSYCSSLTSDECQSIIERNDGVDKIPVFKRVGEDLVTCNVAGFRDGEFIGFATGKYSSMGFCLIGEGGVEAVTHDVSLARWFADKFECRVVWCLNVFNLREILRVAKKPVRVISQMDFDALCEIEKGNADQIVEIFDINTGLTARVDAVEKILDDNSCPDIAGRSGD